MRSLVCCTSTAGTDWLHSRWSIFVLYSSGFRPSISPVGYRAPAGRHGL